MRKDLGRKYISRMEGKPMWGWKIAVPVQSRQIQQYFGDKAHGGVRKSYAAAKARRDELIRKHNIDISGRRRPHFNRSHPRNTSGTIGVHLQLDERGPTPRVNWVAQVMVEGKQSNRSWSIRKYGYAIAFKLATKYRANFTKKRPVTSPPPAPAWLKEWVRSLPEEEQEWVLPLG